MVTSNHLGTIGAPVTKRNRIATTIPLEPATAPAGAKIASHAALVIHAHTPGSEFIGPEKILPWKLLRIAAAVDGYLI
jgi:hypothetical protein